MPKDRIPITSPFDMKKGDKIVSTSSIPGMCGMPGTTVWVVEREKEGK